MLAILQSPTTCLQSCNLRQHACNLRQHACNLEILQSPTTCLQSCNLRQHACNLAICDNMFAILQSPTKVPCNLAISDKKHFALYRLQDCKTSRQIARLQACCRRLQDCKALQRKGAWHLAHHRAILQSADSPLQSCNLAICAKRVPCNLAICGKGVFFVCI